MTPERWQHIKSLLHSALEHDPAERDAFLIGSALAMKGCEEIESLITRSRTSGRFHGIACF